jgi:hypothetical protein
MTPQDRAIIALRADVTALQQALAALVAQWRENGAHIDAVHATMGVGYKACADQLAAVLAGEA